MTVLIAGCGYLGRRIAGQLRERGCDVVALVRSEAAADALQREGWTARAGDIGRPEALDGIAGVDAVVHTAASGRGGPDAYRAVYLQGCRNLLDAFPNRPLLFTSSTSVYRQTDGSWVSETSPALPHRDTGKILLEAEHLVLDGGGTVLRLAGIYGPGRSVLLKNFLLGRAQIDIRPESPVNSSDTPVAVAESSRDGRWINQIHRDDAAAAVVHLLLEAHSVGIFNVSDSQPMTQREIYTELARRFARPLPPERSPAVDSKRGWTNKRVSNALLRQTGWTPRYPSWWDALAEPDFVPSIRAQIPT